MADDPVREGTPDGQEEPESEAAAEGSFVIPPAAPAVGEPSTEETPGQAAATAATTAAGEDIPQSVDPDDLCPLCGGALGASQSAREAVCGTCGSRLFRHRSSERWVAADPALRSTAGLRRWRQEHAEVLAPCLGVEVCPVCLNLLRFPFDGDEVDCPTCGNRIQHQTATGGVVAADVRLRSPQARENWRREHPGIVVPMDEVACPVCGESLQVLPYKDETACTRCGSRLIRHRVSGEWIHAPAPAGAAAAGPTGEDARSGSPGQAIAGFVCSILGLILVWVPFLGIILGIAGVILSVTGRNQGRSRGQSTTLAVAGLIIGLVAIGLWVLLTAIGIALYGT